MSATDQNDDQAAGSGQEAAEQAKVNQSAAFSPQTLHFDDGTWMEIPPHPYLRMMRSRELAAYDELMFEADTEYERGPDVYVPEQTVKDSAGNELTLPSETRPGNLLVPYRKRNPDTGKVELVKPPHEEKVVQVVLGPEKYAELQSKQIGGRPGDAYDVWQLWNGQGSKVTDRRDADPKSDRSPGVLEDVPAPDSE